MTDVSTPASSSRKLALHVIAWIACLIIVAFVVHALIDQFHKVDWSQVRFRPLPTIAAIACVFGVSMMQLTARWTLLLAYGYPLNWRIQLSASWLPQIGKYIPGGIASVGGAVLILRRHGVPGAIGLSVSVLLDALAVMAGLIVSTPLLLWEPVRTRLPFAWLACIALTVVGLLLLHPRVFVALLNWALQKIHRQPIAQAPPASKYLLPVLASFAQWLFAGLALWFMTDAVIEVPAKLLPLFFACAALAMTASYLTPFAPGGIGIREGLYLLTLGPLVGPTTAVVAVAMRVVQTVMELLLAAIGAMYLRSGAQSSPLLESNA